MNDDTKYRDRHIAAVLISRLLKKTGLSAKAGGAWGAVAITAGVVGGMYALDFVLEETIPIPTPTPIVEPVAPPPVIVNVNVGEHETPTPIVEVVVTQQPSTHAALPEKEGVLSPPPTPSPASAPMPTEETPTWTPTPRLSTSPPSPSKNETSTVEVIEPASSPVPASTSTPESTPTPEPTATPAPQPTATQTPLPQPSATAQPIPPPPPPSSTPTPESTPMPTPLPTATTTPSPVTTSTPARSDAEKPKPTSTQIVPTPTTTPDPKAALLAEMEKLHGIPEWGAECKDGAVIFDGPIDRTRFYSLYVIGTTAAQVVGPDFKDEATAWPFIWDDSEGFGPSAPPLRWYIVMADVPVAIAKDGETQRVAEGTCG